MILNNLPFGRGVVLHFKKLEFSFINGFFVPNSTAFKLFTLTISIIGRKCIYMHIYVSGISDNMIIMQCFV